MNESPFLVTMQRVVGRIEVQPDLARRLALRFNKQLHQQLIERLPARHDMLVATVRRLYQTVREKFGCRGCEKASRPPAPFHALPRGWAGPNRLAASMFEKYGQHQPLNHQSERYAREGVELSVSTLAD